MKSEIVNKTKQKSGKKVTKNSENKEKKVAISKSNEYDDSWIYILLLSTVVILAESLKNYQFSFENVTLTYSLILLPFIYFITNYITKKYGYKKSIVGISMSGLALVAFALVMNFATGRATNMFDLSGGFCGYVISQFVNLTIYDFLLNNTESPFILVFLTYIFALVVNYLFYTLIRMNMLALDNYWISYFSTLIIQGILCLLLTFFDGQIKKGL